MGKFYGKIGFVEEKETKPSVFTPIVTEHGYVCEVLRNSRKLENGDGVNSNVNINNEISILADPYARNHFHTIRYIFWHGSYWDVTGVTEELPRLRLTIGGVYNGPTRKT